MLPRLASNPESTLPDWLKLTCSLFRPISDAVRQDDEALARISSRDYYGVEDLASLRQAQNLKTESITSPFAMVVGSYGLVLDHERMSETSRAKADTTCSLRKRHFIWIAETSKYAR